MVSLADINATLFTVQTRITHIQNSMDKVNTYLDSLVTHTVSVLLLPTSILRKILENIKRGMAQHH